MYKRLAQHIRDEMDTLVDQYDVQLRLIPGYAELPGPARYDLERHVLELMITCLETDDEQPLIDYVHERAREVLALGFDMEWFQQSVAVPEEVVMPLVETVAESNFVWKVINRAQQTAWHIVVTERKQAEQRFRTVADFAYSWETWLAPDGRYIYVSPACLRISGYPPQDFMDRPELFVDIAHPDDRVVIERHVHEHGTTAETEPLEYRILTKDGQVRWINHVCVPVHDAQGNFQGRRGSNTDITARKQAEAQVQRNLQETHLRLEISRALAEAQTQEQVLDVLIQHADVDSQAHVSLFTLEQQKDDFVITLRRDDLFNSGMVNPMPVGTRLPVSRFPMGHQITATQSFITHDFLADERIDAASRELGLHTGSVSLAAFPLSVGSDWLGVLVATSKSRAYFDEDKQHLYQTLAELGAVALQTARLRDEIQASLTRRGFQVQTSTEVAQEIAAAPELDELFKRVVTLIKERFGYYHAQLFRYDADRDAVVLVAGYGEVGKRMRAAGHQLAMGRGVVGTAAATGRSILATNVAADKDWRPNPHLPDTQGELAVPIKLRDQVLGILDVQSDQAGALTQEDQLLLEGLCGQIAVAIEGRRVEDALREHEEDLNVMLESSPEAIGVVNTQTGLFEGVNHAAEQLYGLKRDELIKVGPAQMSPEFQPDGRPSTDAALEKIGAALNGETPVFEWIHLNAAGHPIPCEVRLVGLTGTRSHLVRFSVTDITERKRAEETLAAERNLIRTLIDTIPDLIYAKDVDSRFILANTATARQMGAATAGDLLGKSDLDFYPHELALQYLASEQPIVREGKPVLGFEEPTIDAGGHARWQTTTKVPLRNAAGEIIGLVGITSDITERKDFEKALTQERQLLRTLMQTVPDYFYVKNARSEFVLANQALADVLHLESPDELIGKTDFDFFPRDMAEKFYQDEQTIIQSGQPLVGIEEPSQSADGRTLWVSTSKVPFRNSHGEVEGIVGLGRDITERKQVEEMVRRSEAQLSEALKIAKLAYWEYDVEKDLFHFNDQFYSVFHTTAAQAGGYQLSSAQYAQKFVHPDDLPIVDKEIERALNSTERHYSRQLEYRILYADGGVGYISVSVNIDRDEQGRILRYYGANQDITERKLVEAELEHLLADQQRRALQLQTAAEVSRVASSILSTDELLPQAAELIRARFELYYVGIFLLDESRQWARLRAGTGDAGRQMLAAGHQLKIGGASMISRCISTQTAQIALDVGEAAVRFDNPLLPLTHSEAALPLISRGQTLGAVTIQSDQPAAFSTDDVTVLQSMADQISNAVETAHLYEQARVALAELDATNRRLTGEAWESYLQDQASGEVICVTDDERAAPQGLVEVDDKLSAGEISLEQDTENQGEAIVTAPILLRGQPIGALRVRTTLDDWNQDLQAVLSDMAGHIAQAVENARLVEQTQRTASRERAINEINARVRRTIDLDTILQTAVNELGQTLKAARVVARVGVSPAEGQSATGGNGRGEKNG